jgi:CheY-like chemotaxis protein
VLPRLREKKLYRVKVVSTAQEGLDLIADDEAKLALKQKEGSNTKVASAVSAAAAGGSLAVNGTSGHGASSSSSSSKSGRFWVAIFDLHTPKMDGLQLCRALR